MRGKLMKTRRSWWVIGPAAVCVWAMTVQPAVGQDGGPRGEGPAAGRGERGRGGPGFGPKARFGKERPGGRGRDWDISPAQTERMMEFAEKHFPRRHRLLERLRERNPQEFRRRVSKMAPRVFEMLLQLEENPEMAQVLIGQQQSEDELHELLGQYDRGIDEAEQAETRTQIVETVGQLVDLRLQRRSFEIAALARRIEAQRDRLETDSARREELVEEQVERLLDRLLERRGPRRGFRGPGEGGLGEDGPGGQRPGLGRPGSRKPGAGRPGARRPGAGRRGEGRGNREL